MRKDWIFLTMHDQAGAREVRHGRFLKSEIVQYYRCRFYDENEETEDRVYTGNATAVYYRSHETPFYVNEQPAEIDRMLGIEGD